MVYICSWVVQRALAQELEPRVIGLINGLRRPKSAVLTRTHLPNLYVRLRFRRLFYPRNPGVVGLTRLRPYGSGVADLSLPDVGVAGGEVVVGIV
jgi:hypothetical protein